MGMQVDDIQDDTSHTILSFQQPLSTVDVLSLHLRSNEDCAATLIRTRTLASCSAASFFKATTQLVADSVNLCIQAAFFNCLLDDFQRGQQLINGR